MQQLSATHARQSYKKTKLLTSPFSSNLLALNNALMVFTRMKVCLNALNAMKTVSSAVGPIMMIVYHVNQAEFYLGECAEFSDTKTIIFHF